MNTKEEYVTRGWEFVVDFMPVRTREFIWNTTVNWATVRKYYARLDETYSPDNLWVYKGGRTDHLVERDFNYDPNGNVILLNGYPRLSDYQTRIGYKDPNWVWGWTNTFKYKDFTLSVGIDGRIGGKSNSTTNRSMWQTGAHPDTDNEWRYEEVVNGKQTYVANGVKVVSGSATYDSYGRILTDDRVYAPNDVIVSYETYIKDYWKNGPQLNFDETFIKLRELSINYDIPKTVTKKMGMENASVALVGQNLLLWTKEYRFADPDNVEDDLSSPSLRYIGVNLKVEF
ncbi:MAG: hypothetical protein LUG51_09590 [Tannerellaceae bacterium]|nr:hypothetical protein [Tannerellaceae bacterium]